MSVRFSSAHCGVRSLCVSILLNLVVFSSFVFSQAIDPTFAPLLQNFGSSTSGLPAAHASALQADGKILVGGKFRIADSEARSGIARFNPDSTLDASFDAGDISTVETISTFGDGGIIRLIKIQTDGKILIGGSFTRGAIPVFRQLERLNADGSIDPAFTPLMINEAVNDAEILPDGKILIGGDFQYTAVNPANGQSVTFRNLARLNPNGTFDFSFTGNGLRQSNNIALLPDGKFVVGNAYLTQPGQGVRLIRYTADGFAEATLGEFNDTIEDVKVQADGKIVVGGFFVLVNGSDKSKVARFNADGSLDASFDTGAGFFRNGVHDLEIAPDGKIVIGGGFDFFNDASRRYVARLMPNGALDASFNTSFGNPPFIIGGINDVLPLPDGKVFVGGAFSFNTTSFYNNIARLNANGTIDLNFNNANINYGGKGYSILPQTDGKILIGGNLQASNYILGDGYTRYNADGTPDANFTRNPDGGIDYDIALQSDGKILYIDGGATVLLYRLNPNGTRDTAFPQIFVPFSASIQKRTVIQVIAVQPDNKILVGGYLITGSATSPNVHGLIRLHADGTRDTTFQPVNAFGGLRQVFDLARQPDGKIVIGGDFTQINGNPQFQTLARINPDGTIDTSFNPNPPPPIHELELQPDGKIVYAANALLQRVNADGTLDSSFNASVENNGVLLDILEALLVLPNGRILIGGNFTSVNGTPRNRIARLNPNGALDPAFNLPNGANDTVYDFSRQADGKILVAGAFTRIGNQARIGAARLIESSAGQFDFDGDGRADIGVFRQGNWYLLNSSAGFATVQFGISTDKIVPADYDGDGKTDVGVYRGGIWYLQQSVAGFSSAQFGSEGDIPIQGRF